MASVWYIGYADKRIISSADWTVLGHPGITTTWDKTNGWSVDQAGLTQQQIDYLDNYDEFAVTNSNGPRPGSIVTAKPNEAVTREDLVELTLADLDDVDVTTPSVGKILAITSLSPTRFDVFDANSLASGLSVGMKALGYFYPGTGDHTTAFADAAAWSVANKAPVYIEPSDTPYLTSQPIPVGLNCQFIGGYQPPWSGAVDAEDASTIVSPSASFPDNRGLFEVANTGRGDALRGLSLQGLGRGSGISGIKLPGSGGSMPSGLLLNDLEICGFSGDGIVGGTRVTFLDRLFIHENAGYGININDPWYDCRVQYVYCHYNLLGGLNIDSDSQLNTFFNCRFERSGQIYNDPQNELSSASWNSTAPGIRMRGGQRISFVQCDTDANNGAGLDVAVSSATPVYAPRDCTFVACVFNRDAQGDGQNANATGAGIKVRGYANVGGQTVDYFRLVECVVSAYFSNDDGNNSYPTNPARGVWIENTIFISFTSGGQIAGSSVPFYFGSSTDPATNNWRPYFSLPQYGITMPAPPESAPFATAGMLRENGALQRWDGNAWVNV